MPRFNPIKTEYAFMPGREDASVWEPLLNSFNIDYTLIPFSDDPIRNFGRFSGEFSVFLTKYGRYFSGSEIREAILEAAGW